MKLSEVKENASHETTERIQSPPPTQADEPLALVMKGGGVKGIAYVGALKELEQYYHFNWFVGTSAGAIAAALLAAGYSSDQLQRLLSEKNFKEFLDAPKYKWPTNLFFYKGLHPADSFTQWVDSLVAQKLGKATRVRLEQLPHRVTLYASRRGQKSLVFDSFDPGAKETFVAYAVRCSMAIPFVFIPQSKDGMRVLDGGLQNNYPVEDLLRSNPGVKFVGLYLGPTHYEGEAKQPSLLGELLSIWTESVDVEALEKYEHTTVIIDPRPIKTTDFNLTAGEKELLLKAGRAAALRFIFKQNLLDGPSQTDVEEAERQAAQARTHVEKARRKFKRRLYAITASIILLASGVGLAWRYIHEAQDQSKHERSGPEATFSEKQENQNAPSVSGSTTVPPSAQAPSNTASVLEEPPRPTQSNTDPRPPTRKGSPARTRERLDREKKKAYEDLDYRTPQ